MALQNQSIPINFAQGLDTKTDPFQVTPGKFLNLENSVFSTGGSLVKRNGFQRLPNLPNTSNTFLTTFNGNLTAIGNSIYALSPGNNSWVNKGSIEPVELSTLPLVRTNTNQDYMDIAVGTNGTICTVYADNVPQGSTTTKAFKYVVSDAATGQNLIAPATISAQVSSGSVSIPRTFSLGNYYAIVFGAAANLQYFAISKSTLNVVASATSLSTSFSPTTTGAMDGVVVSNALYLSWGGASNSGIKATYLSSALAQGPVAVIASQSSTLVSVTADGSSAIWTAGYVAGSNSGVIVATNTSLGTLFSAKQFVNSATAQLKSIAPIAQNGLCNVLYEVSNNYAYDSGVASHYVKQISCTSTGSLSASSILVRSVGLASKGFWIGSSSYFMSAYSSTLQPTYFLMNSSGGVIARLAYQNGGGYLTQGLPSVFVNGTKAFTGYLYKDLVQSVNKGTQIGSNTQFSAIYSQTGINQVGFNFSSDSLFSSELGSNLNLTGGMLWNYDGFQATENNFNYYPENIEVTTIGSGGALSAQTYFYIATYEWTDNQGNSFKSSPSVPVQVIVGSATTTATINIPTQRVTYKTANPIKVVLYRWSQAQQSYYQVTSITTPMLNSTTTDYITVTDKLADSDILGNNLIYTTGGVLENTNAPASNAMTLWQSRLWLADAEDPNLLWYSKPVIEATPVEMNDLSTIFVAPTTGAQGSTGPITALSAMDDKLIIFKRDAIYMVNGQGPDSTGANSQYSDPTFITATVGCINQKSVVMTPQGLMFQSDKGIWLLGRDLSSNYIGAPVEAFNSYEVKGALNIPGTNQIRFTLLNGPTLMYDYYYGQWGTFTNIPSVSSALYQSLHSYIDQYGRTFQELPGTYLDGTNPVLMSFTTSWFNLAGLQGYERAKFFYLLANYISPHKLNVQIAYDYNSAIVQSNVITPTNYNGPYGSDTLYGGSSPFGGNATREQWRVFLQRQKCQAFQITIDEIYDSSFGTTPGAGFTLSGLDLVVSGKLGFPRLNPSNSVG